MSGSRSDVTIGRQQGVFLNSAFSSGSQRWEEKPTLSYSTPSLPSELPPNYKSSRFSSVNSTYPEGLANDPGSSFQLIVDGLPLQRTSAVNNPPETLSNSASLTGYGYDVKYAGPLLRLNISGTIFLVKVSTLQRDPLVFDKILEDAEYIPNANEYYFERDPVIFRFVLAYLRHKELHLPMNICGPLMEKELESWGLQLGFDLQRCCLGPVMETKSKMESLRKFEETFSESPVECNYSSKFCIQWQKLRQYVWRIITDTPKKRWLGMLLNRSAQNNTDGENMDDSVSHHGSEFDLTPNKSRHSESIDLENLDGSEERTNSLVIDINNDSRNLFNWRTLQKTPREIILCRIYVAFQFLIVISLMIYMTLAYIPELREPFGPRLRISGINKSTLPDFPVHRSYYKFSDYTLQVTRPILALRLLTWLCVILFTIDLVARGIFCPKFFQWLRSFYTFTDIISLLPFYVEGIILNVMETLPTSPVTEKKVEDYMFVIDIFNMFKVFVICRIFRLLQRQRAARVLIYTIRTAATNIVMVFELMLLCAIFFGTSIFFFDENISSIFVGIWWAFTTMTTVGYGDVIPNSTPGRLIAVLCMVIGILLTSYTIPVLVNDFLLFYGHADQLAWMRGVHKSATVKRHKEKKDLMTKKRIKQVRALIKNTVIGFGIAHEGIVERKHSVETYHSNAVQTSPIPQFAASGTR
nr:potassium voltage gated channel subfamily D [Hymenolepis microstoma]